MSFVTQFLLLRLKNLFKPKCQNSFFLFSKKRVCNIILWLTQCRFLILSINISHSYFIFPEAHWHNIGSTFIIFPFSPRLSIEPPLSLPQNGWVRPLFYLIPPVVYGQEKMVFLFTPPDEVVFCDGLHLLLRLHAKKVRVKVVKTDWFSFVCINGGKRGSVLALLTSCVFDIGAGVSSVLCAGEREIEHLCNRPKRHIALHILQTVY